MRFHSGRGARRGWVRTPAALLLAALVVACAPSPPTEPVPDPITLPSPTTAIAEPVAVPPPPEVPDPVRVRVPAIAVDAPVIPLGLDPVGALEVPSDFSETGWYEGGPEPGEAGPAVIAGHVDGRDGPAVFFDLHQLQPGDLVDVEREDGSTVTFTVERLEQHAKSAFPTQAVYGPTDGPTLRLVTCGGAFDRAVGHYRDNIIVYAVAAT